MNELSIETAKRAGIACGGKHGYPYEAGTEHFEGCYSLENRYRTALFLGSHPRVRGEFVPSVLLPYAGRVSPTCAGGVCIRLHPLPALAGLTHVCGGSLINHQHIIPDFTSHPRERGEFGSEV